MESEWQEKLLAQGYSSRAAIQTTLCLADSTWDLYNRMLKKFLTFCAKNSINVISIKQHDVAEFLCETADSSERPSSLLRSSCAALSHFFNIRDLPNYVQDSNIKYLCDGLVKSGTVAVRKKSNVIPTEPFNQLYRSLGSNVDLKLKDLREKSIVLLAFTAMLRPSDIAPKGVVFNKQSNSTKKVIFNLGQLHFKTDGSLIIDFQGIKNDTDRSGFSVTIRPTTDCLIDPVCALKTYIEQTNEQRVQNPDNPVFLTLTKPYRAIDSNTVSNILKSALKRVGLQAEGFRPKDFRPTGATKAVEGLEDPKKVMRLGRWKTESVFYDHYVHSVPSDTISDNILS